jgi:hypothetical protein
MFDEEYIRSLCAKAVVGSDEEAVVLLAELQTALHEYMNEVRRLIHLNLPAIDRSKPDRAA